MAENKVDLEILHVINRINEFAQYYSTSSCAGRIVLLSKANFRGKYTAEFVYKNHSPLNPEAIIELKNSMKRPFAGQLYFNVEPPTYHVVCNTFEDAMQIHQLALEVALGYSMFKSIKKSIVVEIRGTGLLQVPIGLDNKVYITDEHLDFILALGNEVLSSEQDRVKKLYEGLILIENKN